MKSDFGIPVPLRMNRNIFGDHLILQSSPIVGSKLELVQILWFTMTQYLQNLPSDSAVVFSAPYPRNTKLKL